MSHKHERARLDASRDAKPKTVIVGHKPAGDCLGPADVRSYTYKPDLNAAEQAAFVSMCARLGRMTESELSWGPMGRAELTRRAALDSDKPNEQNGKG